MKKTKLSAICLSLFGLTAFSTAVAVQANNNVATKVAKSSSLKNTSYRMNASDLTWGDSKVSGELDLETYNVSADPYVEVKIKGNVNFSSSLMKLNDKVYMNNKWVSIAGVADRAFVDNKNLTGQVKFGNCVKYINSEAFARTNVEIVDFLTTVDTINANAFANCDNLRQVYFNRNKKPIKNFDFSAFKGCHDVVFYIPHDCYEFADQLQNVIKENGLERCIICLNIDPTI